MNKPSRLTKGERHRRILAEGQGTVSIRVSALADRLGVSTETVRRDLAELCESGHLHRIYGGATVPSGALSAQASLNGRIANPEVANIARTSAHRVRPGQTLKLCGGPIACEVVRILACSASNLMIITNSARIAAIAGANPKIRAILSPGIYDPREDCVCGEDTIDYLEQFSADVGIVEASALTTEGPAEDTPGAAAVKRAMLHDAMEKVVVVEKEGLSRRAVKRVCALNTLDEIVTGAEPDRRIIAAVRKAGVRLSIAKALA